MAKFDVAQLTEMLNEAENNRALLTDLASTVQKYVNSQRKQLDEIEVLLANANAGKLSGKGKKGSKVDKPEIKDDKGNVLDKRSREYKERLAEMNNKK